MKWLELEDVRAFYAARGSVGELVMTLGRRPVDPEVAFATLGIPFHLAVVLRQLLHRGEFQEETLSSLSFYSLCRGLLIPLSGMTAEKAGQLFGLRLEQPDRAERDALLGRFLASDCGLSVVQKVSCLLADPFLGERSKFQRESLLRLLSAVTLITRRELLDRLTRVGDPAILFAQCRKDLRLDPPLTAAEVLLTLRFLPQERRNHQFHMLRSLLERCGKVEAYFLARLILRKGGLQYENELLARLLGEHFHVEPEQITHAMALTDVFHVVHLLADGGPQALRQIELQPLVPLRPALAGGTADQVPHFPVWVERKYDGIRLMLHKTTDQMGSVLCGAYSRNRRDYLEMLPGMDSTIKLLPGQSLILDGEMYGVIATPDGPRPATVYEVFTAISGEARRFVQLRYAAFDLLYWNGEDLTARPLAERRQRLQWLLSGLPGFPLPIPLSLAEGQMANSQEDIKRLYQHFRSQGYEGVIAKDLSSPYRLASRDPSWLKRKPEVTLDLVLTAAILAVTSKEKAGLFGSYVIAAKNAEGGFDDVGDVAGVDTARDLEIQQLIMSEGLLTGQRLERTGISGTRPGFELVPHIVVTVRFAGVVREPASGRLSLRDPKLAVIRSDKSAHEADSVRDLENLYLQQSVG